MPQKRSELFLRLVAPHIAMLHRVAYRLVRNAADADDLVQDTCVTACERPDDIGAADHPERWLLRVLHNRFIDMARRGARAPFATVAEADALAHMPCPAPGPDELLQQADGERALEQAFLQLEPVQRTLLVLRVEGHDLGQIEAITGIGREVLRDRLHRARRSLAQRLNEQRDAQPRAVHARSKA